MATALRSAFLLLLLLLGPFLVEADEQLFHFCGSTGDFTPNSNYEANLAFLLASIISDNSITYGFYNFSSGESPDTANGIALCRGDVTVPDCRACLYNSSLEIVQLCPVEKEAVMYHENCMLRYSDDPSIFGAVASNYVFFRWHLKNATSPADFNRVLRELMDGLRIRAAAGSSTKKFAVGNAAGPDFQTLYGLAQCTPDLSETQCNDCLVVAISDIPQCCGGKTGGWVVGPSCNLRFDTFRFYDEVPSAPPATPSVPPATPLAPPATPLVPPPSPTGVPPPSPTTNGTVKPTNQDRTGISGRTIIMIVIGVSGFMLLIAGVFACWMLIRKTPEAPSQVMEEITAESLQYDIGTIRIATNDFSEENTLGHGGFGTVYKGTLAGGQDIAVKRLSRSSRQGDVEFRNELLLLAKLQHRNLVRLLGFCLTKSERLLIYEFVPKASLDYYIFDPVKRGELHWEIRYNIIKGIAKGLLYLHEDSRLRVIHRDLKAGNILLDAEMNPKIADFGLARLFPVDQTQDATAKIVGTYGYMAPEYAMNGVFSVKSDVYSFGILLLEILSGQRSCSFRPQNAVSNLLSFAWKSWKEGTISNLIDPTMKGRSMTDMSRCIHIGLLCVQDNAADRPNMASVVLMLNTSSVTLPLPSRPASSNPNTSKESSWASSLMEYDSKTSNTGGLKSKFVRGSSSIEASISAGELFPR